ncbi:MAG: hypothetical protein JW914_01295 [Syntrophaceae bacterium]|nr:hypothetical protein [Syntrophaceae bacterium]
MLWGILFVLIILNACTLKKIVPLPAAPPEGVWTYPGGGAEPMSIIFNADGTLTFAGGFLKFNPSNWQYDKKTHKLQVKVPGNETFETYCGDDYDEEYSCLHFNNITDTFECKLTEKTKSINFLGWSYLRQQKK